MMWPVAAHAQTPAGGEVTWSSKAPVEAPAPEEASTSGKVRVEITGDAPDIAVHEWVYNEDVTSIDKPDPTTGRSLIHHDLQPRYATLCVAPCTTTFTPGEHRLALSHGTAKMVELPKPVTITGPTRLQIAYTSNAGVRAAGYVLVLGATAGAVGIFYAGRTGKRTCDRKTGKCTEEISPESLVGGIAVLTVGVIAGVALALVSDKADIKAIPLPSAGPIRFVPQVFASYRERGMGRGSDVLEGAGLAMQFDF
ncbi:hypothetical protein [Pendulispora albinea]|uniref:PEGA domain-containing protein n=1 Tax=Pendulispora albinea TaxID=2741071 RepID=A0ABZ2MC68_9BACT